MTPFVPCSTAACTGTATGTIDPGLNAQARRAGLEDEHGGGDPQPAEAKAHLPGDVSEPARRVGQRRTQRLKPLGSAGDESVGDQRRLAAAVAHDRFNCLGRRVVAKRFHAGDGAHVQVLCHVPRPQRCGRQRPQPRPQLLKILGQRRRAQRFPRKSLRIG